MAPDDDDDRRLRNARDDRRQADRDAAKRSGTLNEALGKGHVHTARAIVGVPPAGTGSGHPGEPGVPERTVPRTAVEDFRKHKVDLLCHIERAGDFLPRELLKDWAQRLEPLDLERPGAELAIIDPIRHEYERVAIKPLAREWDRYRNWEHHVPRIGHEIEWLTSQLLAAPLESRPHRFWWDQDGK